MSRAMTWQLLLLFVHLYLHSSSSSPLSPPPHLQIHNASLSPFLQNISAGETRWPRLPAGRVDVPHRLLSIEIHSYGNGVPVGLKEDVLASLILIEYHMMRAGNPDDIILECSSNGGVLSFRFIPARPLRASGIWRNDLTAIIDTIGGLTLLDGPRQLTSAYVSKVGRVEGWLSLTLRVT